MVSALHNHRATSLKFGRIWPSNCRNHAKFGRNSTKLVESMPNSAEIGPSSVKLGRTWRYTARSWPEFGQHDQFGRIWPTHGLKHTQSWTDAGRVCAKLGRDILNVAVPGRTRAESMPKSAEIAQCWPTSGQVWARLAHIPTKSMNTGAEA